jgi:hypothetical protein
MAFIEFQWASVPRIIDLLVFPGDLPPVRLTSDVTEGDKIVILPDLLFLWLGSKVKGRTAA